MIKEISEVTVASPTFKEVLNRIDEKNEEAAVDIYCRMLIGLVGLVIAVLVFIFAAPSDKLLGTVFLIFPVFPVFWGVSEDYTDAKRELLGKPSEVG